MVYCRVDSGSSNRIRLALDISRIRQEGRGGLTLIDSPSTLNMSAMA